jgi:hypothetical protein
VALAARGLREEGRAVVRVEDDGVARELRSRARSIAVRSFVAAVVVVAALACIPRP